MTVIKRNGQKGEVDYLKLVNLGSEGYRVTDHVGESILELHLEDEDLAFAIFDFVVKNWESTQRRANLVEGRENTRSHIIKSGIITAKYVKDKKMQSVFEELTRKLPISEQTDISEIRAFFAKHNVKTSVDPD